MNHETIATQAQNLVVEAGDAVYSTMETSAILPIDAECFGLVGGGSSIVLFD